MSCWGLGDSNPRESILYTQRKNLLDIYPIGNHHVGLFRDPFERVMELEGFELTPTQQASEVWEFRHLASGLRGRLLNVESYLEDRPLSLTVKGRTYMITRQDFTLALLLPGRPRRIKLSETRYKVVSGRNSRNPFPVNWPEDAVNRVIRHRFRTITILEEGFLLRHIGLRGEL